MPRSVAGASAMRDVRQRPERLATRDSRSLAGPSPSDESAIVSIGYRPPGRLIGKAGLNLLVWPSGRPDSHYQRPSYGVEARGDDRAGGAFPLRRAAERRARGGGTATRHGSQEPERRGVRARTALLRSRPGASAPERNVDVVVMGMLAGWSVDGRIADRTLHRCVGDADERRKPPAVGSAPVPERARGPARGRHRQESRSAR